MELGGRWGTGEVSHKRVGLRVTFLNPGQEQMNHLSVNVWPYSGTEMSYMLLSITNFTLGKPDCTVRQTWVNWCFLHVKVTSGQHFGSKLVMRTP